MLFNSYAFILFVSVVLILHYIKLPWKVKKVNLLAASYIFYAAWNPPFVILLWLSTVVDFFVGKKLYETENKTRRKQLLVVSLVLNLGMLAFFKYGAFLLENFVALASLIGWDYHPAAPDIILPVGISFYTFQTLSYTLDMYRKNGKPEKSLLDFSLFVTFFPQLVAGPIVRPGELIPQFKTPQQANRSMFVNGAMLLSLGLFMKVVLADTMLSTPADTVFGEQRTLLALDAWLGVLAFSGQIFFDFAGYSSCAIGMAMMLGFSLPHNFRYPYAAIGFSDFWKRWHITLSTWLRDYVYIPLGGNRNSATRTYINLMLTMLLGGLWHGASWTFVVWGALHGIFLCVERIIRTRQSAAAKLKLQPVFVAADNRNDYISNSFIPSFSLNQKMRKFLLAMITFLLVNITWVFFRAEDFDTAWRMLASMFGLSEQGVGVLPTIDIIKVVVITIALVASHWFMRESSVAQLAQKTKWWVVSIAWALMLMFVILAQKSSDSFIYFQF